MASATEAGGRQTFRLQLSFGYAGLSLLLSAMDHLILTLICFVSSLHSFGLLSPAGQTLTCSGRA